MSTELYQDAMKDRNHMDQSNPRTSSVGFMSSSDYQYKNFLAGMKPRNKNQTGGNNDVSLSRQSNLQSSSFVESAARRTNKNLTTNINVNSKSESEPEDEKLRAHKSIYAEFSKVPGKKSLNSSSYNQNADMRKRSNSGNSNLTNTNVQTETFGSVDKLRSLFDNPEIHKPKLRNNVSKNQERPLSVNCDFGTKSNVSDSYDQYKINENRRSLDVNSTLEISSNNDENHLLQQSSPVVTARTKQYQYSVEENDNENIVSSKTKQIDISSILAPSDLHDHIDSESLNTEVTAMKMNDDLQKNLEVDRLKRAQETIAIEKRFNVKRRSLKERLSLLASEDDPYSAPDTYVSLSVSKDSDDENSTVDSFSNEVLSLSKEDSNVSENSNLLFQHPPTGKVVEYKSAVERFDEFITKEDMEPNQSTTSEASDRGGTATDYNQNLFKLKNAETDQSYSDADTLTDNESNNDDGLLDSILQHMEQSEESPNLGKDYISLLRSESVTESDITRSEANERVSVRNVVPSNSEKPPAVLPRLSKQMAYNSQISSSSSIVSDEEPITPSRQLSVNAAMSLANDPSTASPESNTSTECESESSCGSVEDVRLPQPPGKSLLKTKKSEKKKKVVFKTKQLHQFAYTYGPEEYNRSNTDIDPIASSAEWELEKRVENMDIFSVDLHKDERGLGLSIIGLGVGTENGVEKLGIFVKTLTEKGAAQKDGRIQVNDQILEVNGVSLVGVTQYFAAQTLKGTNGVVRFLMGREKSRHTHLSPGAPLAENPDMKKHIEEMNKILHQLEVCEKRAINAENTLEDVRVELLKAEERAHDAEHQLSETREQLKVVTESPFIGNQRKMKNEIKKMKGGKQEKVEELQKNLKNVSERLSISEDSLLEFANKNEEKNNEMKILQSKLDDSVLLLKRLEEANQLLNKELAGKLDTVKHLQQDNESFKKQLDEQAKAFEEEQSNKERMSNDAMEKEKVSESQITELRHQNDNLLKEVQKLNSLLEQSKCEATEKTSAIENLNEKNQELINNLAEATDQNKKFEIEINNLKEKNEYLLTLISKVEPNAVEITSDNNACIRENEELKAKIVELEERIKQSSKKTKYFSDLPIEESVAVTTSIEVESAPPLVLPHQASSQIETKDHSEGLFHLEQKRSVDVTLQGPPDCNRSTKPNSLTTGNKVVEQDVIPLSVENVEDSNRTVLSNALNTSLDRNLNSKIETNPIPKPPRGHFLPAEDEFVIVESPDDEDIESAVSSKGANLTLDLPDSLVEEQETVLENSSLIQGVSNSIIISAVSEAAITPEREEKQFIELKPKEELLLQNCTPQQQLSTDISNPKKDMNIKYLQEPQQSQQPPTSDSLKKDRATSIESNAESEADEGQFQLITEEIQDETGTPARSVGDKNIGHQDRSSFFEALNREPGFNTWLDDEWDRLDSDARDEKAEKIAAQMTARSPTKQRGSLASSSSSEDDEEDEGKENKPRPTRQSIKIDASYFQKSTKEFDSFDQEPSVLDDEVKKIEQDEEEQGTDVLDSTTDIGVVKSLSFDSAIPPTDVLDNKGARDKRELIKGQDRKKPTQGARGSLAFDIDDFQVSSLPRERKTHSQSTPNLLATSTPNLLSSTSSSSSSANILEKPHNEKQHKSKFNFHIPKVFKKNKPTKKQHSLEKHSPTLSANSPSIEQGDSHQERSPSTHSREVSDVSPPSHTSTSSSVLNSSSRMKYKDADVVPLEQKVDAEKQQHANDIATEEAVVPFADKEMLMSETHDEDDEHLNLQVNNKLTKPPHFVPSAQVKQESDSDEESDAIKEATTTTLDDVEIELIGKVDSEPRTTSITSSTSATDTNPRTTSNASSAHSLDAGFDERGVDVANAANGHSAQEQIQHWTRRAAQDWDVRQVGLWLVEMNLSEYVNSFKSHNVDGQVLLRADGNRLKEYGVHSNEHRAEIKRRIKDFRSKLSKDSFNKGRTKDYKSTKDKLQFWKAKYKVPH